MNKYTIIVLLSILLILETSNANAVEQPIKYESCAIKLKALGVFKGTENGFELDRKPTRIEGLVVDLKKYCDG